MFLSLFRGGETGRNSISGLSPKGKRQEMAFPGYSQPGSKKKQCFRAVFFEKEPENTVFSYFLFRTEPETMFLRIHFIFSNQGRRSKGAVTSIVFGPLNFLPASSTHTPLGSITLRACSLGSTGD